jgi:ribosomal protein L11 methylase PrmA
VSIYSHKFYDLQKAKSLLSAKEIVPIILEIFEPKSIVDIGCGSGAFLSIFQQQGINNILGIDAGDIDESNLFIPIDKFLKCNLEKLLQDNCSMGGGGGIL